MNQGGGQDGNQEQSDWLRGTVCPELRVSEQGVLTAGVKVEDDVRQAVDIDRVHDHRHDVAPTPEEGHRCHDRDEGAAQDQIHVGGTADIVRQPEGRQVRLRKPDTRYPSDVYDINSVFKEAVLDSRTRGQLLIEVGANK